MVSEFLTQMIWALVYLIYELDNWLFLEDLKSDVTLLSLWSSSDGSATVVNSQIFFVLLKNSYDFALMSSQKARNNLD